MCVYSIYKHTSVLTDLGSLERPVPNSIEKNVLGFDWIRFFQNLTTSFVLNITTFYSVCYMIEVKW